MKNKLFLFVLIIILTNTAYSQIAGGVACTQGKLAIRASKSGNSAVSFDRAKKENEGLKKKIRR